MTVVTLYYVDVRRGQQAAARYGMYRAAVPAGIAVAEVHEMYQQHWGMPDWRDLRASINGKSYDRFPYRLKAGDVLEFWRN